MLSPSHGSRVESPLQRLGVDSRCPAAVGTHPVCFRRWRLQPLVRRAVLIQYRNSVLAPLAQPRDIFLGGDARDRDHRGLCLRAAAELAQVVNPLATDQASRSENLTARGRLQKDSMSTLS